MYRDLCDLGSQILIQILPKERTLTFLSHGFLMRQIPARMDKYSLRYCERLPSDPYELFTDRQYGCNRLNYFISL